MSNPNISGGRSALILAGAALSALALTGCGASRQDSQKALDGVVMQHGYAILTRGDRPDAGYGAGMIYDEVAVGPDCVAEVWSSDNDADLKVSMGDKPITVYVYSNPELGHNKIDTFQADRYTMPKLRALLGRPAVAHSCPPA